jgi:glycosyltransferase involved in cell wall biosynthesis
MSQVSGSPETLLVPLSRAPARAREATRRLLDTDDPAILPVAEIFNGGLRVVRDRSYEQLVFVGEPPADELGYGFGVLAALVGRPRRVVLIDLEREHVVAQPLLRYLVRSVPLAVGQLAASGAAVAAQLAAIPFIRATPRMRPPRPNLSRLVYLRPSVGSGSPVGGSITHSHEVIRALFAVGVEVTAFTTDRRIAATVARDPESPYRWQVVSTPRTLKAIAASSAVGGDVALVRAAMCAARAADAIYQRHGRFSLVGALLAHLTGRPLILEYNGSEEWVAENWTSTTSLKAQIAACEEAALRAATRIVVVSEVDRRSLLARGVGPERILLNPNGVDAERFAIGGGTEMRRRHGIAEDSIVIGFVGTFGPWHGAPVLARAFVSDAQRVQNIHLLLVGDGNEREATSELVKEGGLDARMTMTGHVPPWEIPGYLDACDILVAPHVPLADDAEFFGSPTKLFEYMAAGKAIVASRLGQIGDVLEHGSTAWMVEPGSVEDLADALLSVATAPELRHELGTNARRQAIEHHSWQLNARRLVDAYSALAMDVS